MRKSPPPSIPGKTEFERFQNLGRAVFAVKPSEAKRDSQPKKRAKATR